MSDRIVFDLETQYAFHEVGGRDHLAALRVSVLGLYSYATGQYRILEESAIAELEPLFSQAAVIIGFNIRQFDYPVLAPYLPLRFDQLPTLDLMEEVTRILGHRLSLDNLSSATLGEKKQGSGLDAIRYFRAGEIEKLSDYCLHDVRLTKALYEYGARHGVLYYHHRNGQRREIPVQWGQAEIAAAKSSTQPPTG